MSEEISLSQGKDFAQLPNNENERPYRSSDPVAPGPHTASGKPSQCTQGRIYNGVHCHNTGLTGTVPEGLVLMCFAEGTQSLQADNPPAGVLARAPTPPARTSSALAGESGNVGRTAPSLQAEGQASSSTLAAPGQPTNKRSLLKVPSRSSSQLQPSPTATALTGATASDLTGSIDRSSKGSMSEGRRAGSIASSHRSKHGERGGAEAVGQVKSGPESQSASTPKQRRRGLSRLFVIFNCCRMPEKGTPVDTEDPSRPAKAEMSSQPAQGRQAVPGGKQVASAAESSTAESKEPIEEKTGGPPYTETLTPAIETQAVQNAGVDTTGIEKPRVDAESEVIMISRKEDLDEVTVHRDPPLPPLPDNADLVRTNDPASEGSSKLADIQVLVQAPTPVISQHEQETIADRTPQQARRDSDIEMTDAPSPVPTVDEPAVSLDNVHEEPKVDLPPPPPLVDASTTAASAQGTAAVATPKEKPQWLLPPIQPRFQGKKCLVLDLDETLVHSSFKVRI